MQERMGLHPHYESVWPALTITASRLTVGVGSLRGKSAEGGSVSVRASHYVTSVVIHLIALGYV